MNSHIRIIKTAIINPVSDTETEFISDGAAVLEKKSKNPGEAGFVFRENGTADDVLKKYSDYPEREVIDRPGTLMLPSFFDMHFHWVQDDVRMMPKENLLNWLEDYVWPYESKFSSMEYSELKGREFAEKLAASGTLGGACYCSIHRHTVDHALKFFKGSFAAGNVLMTMNSPPYLTQTEQEAVSITEEKSAIYKKRYAVTPRFAPTTSPDVMIKCAEIARSNNSFIQTHLSETRKEIDFVLSYYRKYDNFRDAGNYTEIYNRCGILGPGTIMGHCIHISDSELEILRQTGTAIAHCPSSNAPVSDLGLGSGLFDFRKAEKAAVRWALASDIGGGPYLSMFDVMRSFVVQNRAAGINEATFTKALYRATAAGAGIMGIDKTHGTLDSGKSADFILIDCPSAADTAEKTLENVIMAKSGARDSYIDLVQSTFLEGREIYSRKNH